MGYSIEGRLRGLAVFRSRPACHFDTGWQSPAVSPRFYYSLTTRGGFEPPALGLRPIFGASPAKRRHRHPDRGISPSFYRTALRPLEYTAQNGCFELMRCGGLD